MDIFSYIGGVPGLIVVDNATGVGRRIGAENREAKLFAQYQAHVSFGIRFYNPNSGNEKGNVENKIGYTHHRV